ncbi:peptidase inhibitor family I36 protein [Nonomuraea sp. LPB2021202275-12-8]|uniref:peptidase inhibitor family I36 protein n=1 Tax=Nonomuraea sp. LPB2021202275-12-8 TaxID=3120159 RepID=UPI00300D7D99
MRIKAIMATAAALALGAVAFTPSAAVAEDCPLGFVCFYYGYNQTGGMSFKTDKDWTNQKPARSYFNNARPQTGYDHVDITVLSVDKPICAHYGESEGKGNISAPPASIRTVSKVRWRGEC